MDAKRIRVPECAEADLASLCHALFSIDKRANLNCTRTVPTSCKEQSKLIGAGYVGLLCNQVQTGTLREKAHKEWVQASAVEWLWAQRHRR